MKTLHIEKKTAALSKRLFKLERQGRYDEALADIEDLWQDKTGLPDVEDLEPKLAAEMILRCGSLIGFYGHNKQIPKSQERSKNLLSEARNRFLEMYEIEKVAECENYTALAYWRTGELNEAEVWIEESLSRNLPDSNEIKLHSVIINCLILLSNGRYEDILDLLKLYKKDFLASGNNAFKGDFYNHYGLALKNTGKIKEALVKLESARHYHQRSKHRIYLGTVENNLAQTYKLDRDFPKAHESIDNAAKLFKQLKDRTREGFSLDTKAQIFLDEGKYTEALKTVEKAIKILRLSENAAYLVETYLTKVKTLLYLDRFSDATFCLFEAVQIARTSISEAAAKKLVAEFETVLKIREAKKINEAVIETAAMYEGGQADEYGGGFNETGRQTGSANEDLKLLLPKELSHYDADDLGGVWLSSDALEDFGLTSGSFALIVNDELKGGELAAVEEIADGAVICGKYDSAFGMVCLEGKDGELELFDEDQVEILGRIVGVGKNKDADGKLIITPVGL